MAGQERASKIFRRAEIGFNEVELRENLSAISIDPDHATREYLELQLPVKAMSDLLYRSRLFSYLAAATPGLREMVTMGKIWELALKDRKRKGASPYDLVIVDAPATGHGVGFLQTPRNFAEIARVGPMAHQASTIDKTMTNRKRSGAVIVAIPEEMPVNETASLERQLLDSVGISVDAIWMNALYPERFSPDELERIDGLLADGAESSGALRAARDEALRAAAQRGQLERLRGLVETGVGELPFVFAPALGIGELEQLAEALN